MLEDNGVANLIYSWKEKCEAKILYPAKLISKYKGYNVLSISKNSANIVYRILLKKILENELQTTKRTREIFT